MKLAGLPNLGLTIIQRLAEVGIARLSSLRRVGPAAAYTRMSVAAGRRLPVCYYLYSLEGALQRRDWRTLSSSDKARLRRAAGLP